MRGIGLTDDLHQLLDDVLDLLQGALPGFEDPQALDDPPADQPREDHGPELQLREQLREQLRAYEGSYRDLLKRHQDFNELSLAVVALIKTGRHVSPGAVAWPALHSWEH